MLGFIKRSQAWDWEHKRVLFARTAAISSLKKLNPANSYMLKNNYSRKGNRMVIGQLKQVLVNTAVKSKTEQDACPVFACLFWNKKSDLTSLEQKECKFFSVSSGFIWLRLFLEFFLMVFTAMSGQDTLMSLGLTPYHFASIAYCFSIFGIPSSNWYSSLPLPPLKCL